MTDQSDKPKLGTRPPLGLKRTVETGKVKQSFSHGRSNTVVVERKQRRILHKPGEAPPPAETKPESAAPAPTPKPAAPAPKPAAPKRPVDDITARKAWFSRKGGPYCHWRSAARMWYMSPSSIGPRRRA